VKFLCETCRFFDGMPGTKLAACRKKAPRSHLVSANTDPDEQQVRGVWPFVQHDDWCGQHEKRRADA
jgi:hypothetical protein